MKFSDLLDISLFLKDLSLKSFGNYWSSSYISCLLWIITIRFTSGDTKILSNIKMSQNNMTRVVWKNFFCFLCLNYQLQFLKTVIFLAEVYFIFLKTFTHHASRAFNTKFGPQWEELESTSQVKQIFACFFKLVSLILGWNSIKVLRVIKIVKQIKFEGAWWQPRSKIHFAETILAKIFQTNCSFSLK